MLRQARFFPVGRSISNLGIGVLHQLFQQPTRPLYGHLARTRPISFLCSSSTRRLPHVIQSLSRRSAYSTAVVVQPPKRISRLRRYFIFSLVSLSTFTLSFLYGLDHFFPLFIPIMGSAMPSDEETLQMYEAPDDFAREVDEHIRDHWLAVKLRADPNYTESRPTLKIPAEIRGHSLTGGTLAGKDKIVVPPLNFNDKTGNNLISFFYLGPDVSGHPGLVHGGMTATLLDEGLARCCFPALPNKVGVTAMLNIEYKKPTPAGSFLVLKAVTTKVEGRKAFVEGHLETMVGEGEEPEILVSAKALFIEPKGAKAFTSVYKVT